MGKKQNTTFVWIEYNNGGKEENNNWDRSERMGIQKVGRKESNEGMKTLKQMGKEKIAKDKVNERKCKLR